MEAILIVKLAVQNILQLSIAASCRKVNGTASSLPLAGSNTRLPGIEVNYRGNWSAIGASWWVFWASCFQCHGNVALIKFGNSCCFSGLQELPITLVRNGLFIVGFQCKWYLWLLVILLRKCFNKLTCRACIPQIATLTRNLNWFDTEHQINYTVIEVRQQEWFAIKQIMCIITSSSQYDWGVKITW